MVLNVLSMTTAGGSRPKPASGWRMGQTGPGSLLKTLTARAVTLPSDAILIFG